MSTTNKKMLQWGPENLAPGKAAGPGRVSKRLQHVHEKGTSVGLTDDEFKDHLHEQIARLVSNRTGTTLARTDARLIFNLVTELTFRRVVEWGYFRFPGGYGSLKLTQLKEKARPRTMPGGAKVQPKERRFKIKYNGGVAVLDMLGNNPHKYQRKTPRPSILEEITDATV